MVREMGAQAELGREALRERMLRAHGGLEAPEPVLRREEHVGQVGERRHARRLARGCGRRQRVDEDPERPLGIVGKVAPERARDVPRAPHELEPVETGGGVADEGPLGERAPRLAELPGDPAHDRGIEEGLERVGHAPSLRSAAPAPRRLEPGGTARAARMPRGGPGREG